MSELKEIKDYQLNKLAKKLAKLTTRDSSEDHIYDEDGHSSIFGFKMIKDFWENFKTDKDFEYLVSGEYFSDDLDLGGGRSYLLNESKFIDMVFDYMYNILKWSKTDFEGIIFNSTELSDELSDRYDNFMNSH